MQTSTSVMIFQGDVMSMLTAQILLEALSARADLDTQGTDYSVDVKVQRFISSIVFNRILIIHLIH